jgi:RNA polymerase sigma factor (TIGR02999 family)
LFRAIGSELRTIAAARLRQERHSSLSTGDLVNEAIIKLFRLNVMEFQGRAHILALASRLMRQILIDEARKRNRDKHSHHAITLTTDIAQWDMPLDLLSIEMLLEELARIDEQRAQLVEMRFYGGMTNAGIAEVLEVSEPTVKRRWAATRAWLKLRLDRM